MTKKKTTKDRVNQRYIVTEVDAIWTLDFTNIPAKKWNIWILIIADLACKRVLFHNNHSEIKTGDKKRENCNFTTRDVLLALDEAIRAYQKPKMIHTDMGGQFISKEIEEYLTKMEITHSTGDQVYNKFPNQAHETLNRTIKLSIRKTIQQQFNLKQVPKSFEKFNEIQESDQIKALISRAVNQYNNQSHSSLFEASPNIAESALILFQPQQKENDQIFSIAAKSTRKGDELELLKAEVIQQYAGDWLKFFVDWRLQMEKNHAQVLSSQKENAERILAEQKETAERIIAEQKETAERIHKEQKEIITQQSLKISSLGLSLEELQSKLSYMEECEKQRQLQLKLQEERRELRKNRNHRQPRDAATFIELETVFNVIENSDAIRFNKQRDKAAMLLMYLFGIRVGNLLLISSQQLRNILRPEVSVINLRINKSKQIVFKEFAISKTARALITENQEDLIPLLKENDNDLIFTEQGKTTPISREYLTRRTNNILKEASSICGKNLKSHSFRIGLITSIIEVDSLESANKVIGHSNLATTLLYSRRRFDERQLRTIVEKAESFRQKQRIPKKYNLTKKKNLTESKNE